MITRTIIAQLHSQFLPVSKVIMTILKIGDLERVVEARQILLSGRFKNKYYLGSSNRKREHSVRTS